MMLISRTQRPNTFRIDPLHPLARGLVFAGLGMGYGTYFYKDSSRESKGNDGTLTGFTGEGNTPADRWQWRDGRAVLDFAGASTHVLLPKIRLVPPWSLGWRSVGAGGVLGDEYLADGTGLNFVWFLSGVFLRLYVANEYIKDFAVTGYTSWRHYMFSCDGTNVSLYLDGKYFDAASCNRSFSLVNLGAGYNLWQEAFTGKLSDVTAFSRVLSAAEINMLADPSNVMLSGAIREPGLRRSFIGQAGAAAKPWLYAHRRSSRVIGVGI